jgi:outer membrane protein OmpA-like peptidoglycan-associated protein
LTLGLNINLGSRATEPLWWLNPLDYAYSEIRNPRLMRLPKPVLPDADGDGVTDQFDQEQTPAGVPVDTHGVSRDSDGDGVPDARDKELVTPTYCQPVDADGVGKCPCPEGCGTGGSDTACAGALGALPSITFTGSRAALSSDAQGLLASVAARLRNSPECRIVVTSYGASSKSEQQRGWDRVNAVINYMVEREGISGDRFFWQLGQEGGDANTIDLRAATAEDQTLPTTVPAPHPNLRGRR